MIMEALFWLSFVFIAYVYAGYPLLLTLLRRTYAHPVKKAYYDPTVSLIIAAHNERGRIERKLGNCFELDYPKHKLQIIVSLDGPTDGTEFVVWKYAAQGVQMVHSKEHQGKAAALNNALRHATGEIVVFADVRQMFARSAVRELVANFADDSVGAVTGELLLMDDSRREAKSDVGIYWRYEKVIRSLESGIHSVLGATGAIYAIRRDLYCDIPADTLLDDVLIPMRIVLGGKRCVFDTDAKAYDEAACCPEAEYGRKVRTLAGNYQLLTQLPRLLMPVANPVFFQFVSHKAGRLLVPYALIALFVSNLFLLHGFYLATLAGQVAWYLFALGGYVLSRRRAAEPIAVVEESRRAA
ncbi:MAG: glycosyltransferase family 2 protein [Acidobacteria bacterium]|nr:glycosyltransferase family 2 protein [Acidobacteriota bacterium]